MRLILSFQLLHSSYVTSTYLGVHYVQVRIANWTDKQWNSMEALAPPQLVTLFEQMKLRIQCWEIPMPARYKEFLVGYGNPAASNSWR